MNGRFHALLVAWLVVLAAHGQGSFQNLGFESAVIVPIPGDLYARVQFSEALPGWTGYVGGVQQSAAHHNNMFLDSSGIAIIGAGWPYGGRIQGAFTVALQAGLDLGTLAVTDTSLAQTGLIPSSTQTLRFRAKQGGGLFGSGPGDLIVSVDGQILSLSPLGSGPNYMSYGADIHSWAGQTVEVRFTATGVTPHVGNNNWFLDSIAFSDQAVPEPGVFTLFGLGALFFMSRLFNKSRA